VIHPGHPLSPADPGSSLPRPRQRRQNHLGRTLLGALLSGALLLSTLVGGPGPLPVPAALALNDAQQLVVEAWRLVNQSYWDPDRLEKVQWRRLRQEALEKSINSSSDAFGAIEAMLAPLGDPYTRLLRPSDYGALRATTQGTVSGVGLQLGLRADDQHVVVIAPLDDSPASEAHIQPGTEVLAIDGTSSRELGLEGSAARLRGNAGTDVVVKLATTMGSQREVVLERRQVDLQPVRGQVLNQQGHRLGYLRITQFSEPVPDLANLWLRRFAGQGDGSWVDSAPVEGVILDLRNNSGGLVSAGVAVANSLLDSKGIVETQDRGGINAQQSATAGALYGGPLLTLINGGSASASEILAGALQDAGRSSLVGSRSFGKGLIQSLLTLGDGSGLAVSVARYRTPLGREIQSIGLTPDHPLPQPEPLTPGGKNDTWLAETQHLLIQQLVPGTGAN
jgi:carboxyl-terminal processing protease